MCCTALTAVMALATCRGVVGGVAQVGSVWGNDAGRQHPPAAWIPPGADRSEFTVVSSQPFAVVKRKENPEEKPALEQRQTWHRRNGWRRRTFTTEEAAWRRQRSDGATLTARRHGRPAAFTTAEAAIDADAVLERYPGTPQLWTPYTENPAPAYRNKPIFSPDTGFLLEHDSGH